MAEKPADLTGVRDAVEWRISDSPVAYPDALSFMEERVEAIHKEAAPETVWLL